MWYDLYKFIDSFVARITGPCPLWWHATTDRIQRFEPDTNRLFFECADCGRDTSEIPKGTREGRPIVPLKAQPVSVSVPSL